MSLTSDVPYRPTTPPRTIRVADELWADAMRAVEINRENVSLVLRRFLEQYVEQTKREHPDEWGQA